MGVTLQRLTGEVNSIVLLTQSRVEKSDCQRAQLNKPENMDVAEKLQKFRN